MKKISFKGIPITCFETPKPLNETVNRNLWVLENFKARHGRLPQSGEKCFPVLENTNQVFSTGLRKTVTEGLYKRFMKVVKVDKNV